MRLAFFDPSGAPSRLFVGKPEDAALVRADPRYAAHAVRVLDGTGCEDAAARAGLPTLADFDAANPQA